MTRSDDPSDFEHVKYVYVQSSSKAWYLLPIFLSIIGGLVSFAVLRKRDPPLARNTLVLGIILFGLLIAIIAAGSYVESSVSTPDLAPDISVFDPRLEDPTVKESDGAATTLVSASPLSAEQIKGSAITVPYDLLIRHNSIYAGDIIHYTGHVYGVVKNKDGKSYGLKVEAYAKDDDITNDRMIWSNYTPKTDEEKKLIEMLDRQPVISFAGSNNAVNVWATLNGLRTFDIVIDSYDVPETDILILEMLATGKALGGGAVPADILHNISYDKIPDYVDGEVVRDALRQALDAWAAANPTVEFRMVDDKGESDVNIEWAKWLSGDSLGLHVTRDISTGSGSEKMHNLVIRLGSDDCNSDYRQYSKDFLTYVIAHELGHYLGLRHISLSDHLMFSGDPFARADDIFTYNTHGYAVPTIDGAKYEFVAIENLMANASAINEELDMLVHMHAELKSQNDTVGLDDNKRRLNMLTEQRAEIDRQVTCIDQKVTLDDIFG